MLYWKLQVKNRSDTKNSGRADDNIESIKKRFNTYKQQTMPIIDLYGKRNKVVKIDGNRKESDVWEEVMKHFANM